MKKTIRFFLFLFFLPVSVCSQNIDIPDLDYVRTFRDLNGVIAISLFYDSNDQFTFQVGNKASVEIDSLKPFLFIPLRNVPKLYLNILIIEIIADKNIKLKDFEIVREELKRMSMRKVFFSAKSKNETSSRDKKLIGILNRLPSRDEDRIHDFYKKENMNFREKEYYTITLDKEDKIQEIKEGIVVEKIMPPMNMPPPPPPPPELPKKFDEDVAKKFSNTNFVKIWINKKNRIYINSKRIRRSKLGKKLLQEVQKGDCLFILKTDGNATYENYVTVISSIHHQLYKCRSDFAIQRYNKEYDDLKKQTQRKLRSKFPFILIDEPIYYQD